MAIRWSPRLSRRARAQGASGPGHREPVPVDGRGGAEGFHHGCDRGQPVHLLHPELADVGEHRRAVCHRRRDGERGDLVEGRDLARRHLGRAQRARRRGDGDGSVLGRIERDATAHALQHGDEPEAGRSAVDLFHRHAAARHDATGDHEEGGGRRVARHGAVDRSKGGTPDRDHPPRPPRLDRHVRPGLRQHLLGVGARRDRFAHDRRATGGESGEQDGRLHLGARHRRGPVDGAEIPAADHQRG